MSLIGIDVLKRRVGSIADAIENKVFEEAGKEWVDKDFVPTAKQIVHVDTGELRDSISGEATPRQITVKATAPHAVYEEEGTVMHEAHPFMRPALAKTRRKLTAKVRKKLKDEL